MGGTLRAHPGLALGQTHLWICVLTDSGATRRPRVPFPKGTRTNHWILEVFKRKEGQTRKSKTKRQGDDVARKSAELNSAKLNFKQVQVDDQSIPPSSYRSFVAYGGYDEPYAPAEVNGNNSTESL